ncbi:hypothetical protein A2917_03280 [Candidatus Nomurabacteria bacterium RIFCSPLOWO2_01_FULL_42_17]|uniref:Uncharacterized protein n=1 Tax=Candidatus Nomurabacteria bacterium RIFCSPLOWO2_01_FULL_42_17 TaxID=1801780 RepID=A0A1F6XN31_9BACT|nr:MAG: hypothetical protein A2917_03280 [Candidatus Nomurabacteria bacterium RIFCSPLOWO2_01_FULL_42_17]
MLTLLLRAIAKKIMSQAQYLKMLEREIQKINKKIDLKILQGQEYRREARDHKLLLRKVRYNTRKNLAQKIIHLFFRRPLNIRYA